MSLRSAWANYMTSDLNLPRDDSRYRLVYLINAISLLMILALSFFVFYNFIVTKLFLLSFIELAVLIFSFIPIFILRKLHNINLSATLVTINLFLLMLLFIYAQKNLDFALVQAVYLPVVAIFLKGKKFGTIYSLIFIAIISYIAYRGIGVWEPAPFTFTSFLNLLSCYIFIIIMIYFFESSRGEAFSLIHDASEREHRNNLKLHEKTILLNQANDELLKYKNDLEQQVDLMLKEKKAQEEIIFQQSKMVIMGEMLSAITHQWKQPLSATTSIVANIKIAEALNESPNNTYIQDMERIEVQLDFMAVTISDFSNFLKPHKVSLDFKISEITQGISKLLAPQLNDHNITLLIEYEDENLYINNYKNELIQVLLNILNNAKDAIVEKLESGDLPKNTGEIIMKIYSENSHVIITVSDNAGGIPQTILPKIFTPYFSTKPADKGTGIGLYMSQSIIEDSLQGTLNVHNGDNGAVFTITL